jgi:hypothetical protein
MADPIPCPFVYSTGKRCTGHVAKVEAYNADLEWSFDTSNGWTFSAGSLGRTTICSAQRKAIMPV